jgi:hypothetical protein
MEKIAELTRTCCRKRSVVKGVVRLLSGFCSRQRGPEVRTLMALLYQPLLWRYLKVIFGIYFKWTVSREI